MQINKIFQKQPKANIILALGFFFFLSFSTIPEISVFITFFAILFYRLVSFKIQNNFFYFLTPFFFLNILLSIRQETLTPLLLSISAVVFLYFYSNFASSRLGFFGILFGSSFMVFLSIFQAFGIFQTYNWSAYASDATLTQKDSIYILTPLNKLNASASYSLGFQGPSVLHATVTLRSASPIDINLGFIYWTTSAIRKDKMCSVKTTWTQCTLGVSLNERYNTVLGLGGYGSWKANSPTLEIRDVNVKITNEPSILKKLQNMAFVRVSGFSFNPNAFGNQMAISTLLILIFSPQPRFMLFAIIPLISVLLTGSRGSLAAFLVGALIFLITQNKLYKILPWFFGFVLLGVVNIQGISALISSNPTSKDSQTEVRALNFFDQDSAYGRLALWRLVATVWLENPRTFLVGHGNLRAAMQAKIEAEPTKFNLNKDELTHAHNLFIQSIGESGFLGLCVLLGLWVWAIWRAWQSRDSGALSLLAAIFIMNLTDYLFYYAPVYLAFWMAIVGLKFEKFSTQQKITNLNGVKTL